MTDSFDNRYSSKHRRNRPTSSFIEVVDGTEQALRSKQRPSAKPAVPLHKTNPMGRRSPKPIEAVNGVPVDSALGKYQEAGLDDGSLISGVEAHLMSMEGNVDPDLLFEAADALDVHGAGWTDLDVWD